MKQQQQKVINNDRLGHSRYLMFCGILGYTVCFICDLMLENLPNGILTWEALKDYEKFKQVTEGTTTKRYALSAVIGVNSMIFITLGLMGISEYVHMYSKVASEIMLVGGISATVLATGFHFIFNLMPWFFLTLHATKEGFELKEKFVEDHKFILQIEQICYMIFNMTQTIVLFLGKTPLPRWTAFVNIGFIYLALDYFNVPGGCNFAGAIMTTSFFILTKIYSSNNKNNTNKKNNKKKE
ncbi:hypothetical protein BCR32DRAFT_291192 [Anaeromyces robustus]|uniref:Uncharacterized protein n=1 Tax=Anaeromyces robustus TaxID=1754192 RepID=A0A1Y1XG25_9FUNG|nr:hypothetical protein BCR32DRAFT_291192 [Anaeromyces robustus]|eukprot:ORX84652.1 hypothetical protein BCR32DRAFT_291192 [Anaeromyces robustus]